MRPDKPRRNHVGWLRYVREGRSLRWHALKTDCKWPARHGEAEARGAFVIRVYGSRVLTDCHFMCYTVGELEKSFWGYIPHPVAFNTILAGHKGTNR